MSYKCATPQCETMISDDQDCLICDACSQAVSDAEPKTTKRFWKQWDDSDMWFIHDLESEWPTIPTYNEDHADFILSCLNDNGPNRISVDIDGLAGLIVDGIKGSIGEENASRMKENLKIVMKSG